MSWVTQALKKVLHGNESQKKLKVAWIPVHDFSGQIDIFSIAVSSLWGAQNSACSKH
jgi:hypothetical protein